MNKLINWTFGSFFRTLGRILVYILLALILSYFLKDVKLPKLNIFQVLNVYADDRKPELTLGGSDWNGSLWFSGGRNLTLNVETGDPLFIIDETPSYGYVQFCSYQPITSWYSEDNRFAINIDIYDSGVPCKPPTWSFSGTIRYITFEIPSALCSVQGTSCYVRSSITFYQENSSDYYLMSASLTDVPITIDRASGTIINQNNQIISGQQSIINNQNSNSQAEINNANQNKTDIINNQNSNSQAEINNANQNTDKTIDSQKVCQYIDKVSIIQDGALFYDDGTVASASDRGVTDYIRVNSSTIIKNTLSNNTSYWNPMCFYDVNKSFISCVNPDVYNDNDNITIPANSSFVRFTIYKETNRPQFEICKNGNQAMNDSLDDMNSYLTDDTAPNSDISSLGTVQGLLPAGPVDSLLNIPMTFLSVITSSMGGQCVPLEGNFIFNSTLSIPCFSSIIYDNNSFPSALMVFINLIPSAFILITYFKHLYKKVDRATSLDSNADDEWGVI